MDRSPILVANWKENPNTVSDAVTLAKALLEKVGDHSFVKIVICPPLPFLEQVGKVIARSDGFSLGAQDAHWSHEGPHTGEVGMDMLIPLNVRYILVGHSDRRKLGETDEMINFKLKAALEHNITPVLLVGENEHDSSIRRDVLIDQLSSALKNISHADAVKIIFTYEPVWAISTNNNRMDITSSDINDSLEEITQILNKLYGRELVDSFFYGGSVNNKNISSLLSVESLNGFVIGGASLKPDTFFSVVKALTDRP